MSEQYMCCFCGNTIESTGPDVGALLYTTNWDGPKERQHDQGLFCHASCLEARLHPSVKIYALALVAGPPIDPSQEAQLPDWLR